MKLALGIVLALIAGVVVLWAMGYSVSTGEGFIQVTGPASVSPYDAEASANSPECIGLKERFPEKSSYTAEEFDARSKAAKECIDAKMRYIKKKMGSS